MKEESQEKDFLKYSGNKVPRVIRLVWTALIIFAVYYLVIHAIPDFTEWIRRIS